MVCLTNLTLLSMMFSTHPPSYWFPFCLSVSLFLICGIFCSFPLPVVALLTRLGGVTVSRRGFFGGFSSCLPGLVRQRHVTGSQA